MPVLGKLSGAIVNAVQLRGLRLNNFLCAVLEIAELLIKLDCIVVFAVLGKLRGMVVNDVILRSLRLLQLLSTVFVIAELLIKRNCLVESPIRSVSFGDLIGAAQNPLLTILKQRIFVINFNRAVEILFALQRSRRIIGNHLRGILECAQRGEGLQRRVVIAAFGFVQRFGIHRHLRRVLVAAELLELRGGFGVFARVQICARRFVCLLLAVAARGERKRRRNQHQYRQNSLEHGFTLLNLTLR